MKLFFRLGRNANLSYAELTSFLEFSKTDFSVVHVDRNVSIFEIANFSNLEQVQELQKELGGTIKVGKIIAELPGKNFIEESKQIVLDELAKHQGKKFFGFSLVGDYKSDFQNVSELNKFALEIKNDLASSARVVSSKEIELSSVIVQKEKLLRRGGDFNFIYAGEQRFIGATLAVQEFEEYGFRDYQRPGIDAKSGMLPPKLAKIMINLAKAPKQSTVMDPFCGSGTVLLEFLLKGHKKIIGSDISEKAVADSRRNLDWAAKTFELNISEVQLKQADATTLKLPQQVMAIVTEPYLGPALKGSESRQQIEKIKIDLEELYKKTIANLNGQLVPGGTMVVVVPAFAAGSQVIYLDIDKDFEAAGLKRQNFENIENNTYRQPLVYSRPGQKVLREIIVLRKA